MKNIIYKSVLGFFAATAIVSCKPDLKAPAASAGSVDVSKYVSIGNSITAGYADNALYYDGQVASYANLLAQQFKTIGGGEFKQPLMPMASVGAAPNGTISVRAKLVLGYKIDCKGVIGLSPIPAAASGDAAALMTNISAQGPFNNVGVPGAKATHVVFPGYGNFNPFFGRMTSDKATNSMLSDAAIQKPTFFSLFIGNNDVLGYATSGGTGDVITPSAGPAGLGFDASIDAIIATMTANGAKGVIGNIPDVTNLPVFTTVPYNGLVLNSTQAAGLNAAYAPLGITFKEGANAFIIEDASAPGSKRQIKADEYILLTVPQDSLKCYGMGSMIAIPNKYVLTASEISSIQTAVGAFNSKLKSVADAKGLAYVDVNAFMAQAKKGIVYNGVNTSATFVSGGAFSLDGVHLTPKGNALLANEFIKSINSKYGSGIPQIDVGNYKGVTFPN